MTALHFRRYRICVNITRRVTVALVRLLIAGRRSCVPYRPRIILPPSRVVRMVVQHRNSKMLSFERAPRCDARPRRGPMLFLSV